MARRVLEASAKSAPGLTALKLGEAYDPNMLAAWEGVPREVEAGVSKARMLYEKAVNHDVPGAKRRLDNLNLLWREQAEKLLENGRKLWEEGQVAPARAFFTRAAELGLAEAALPWRCRTSSRSWPASVP